VRSSSSARGKSFARRKDTGEPRGEHPHFAGGGSSFLLEGKGYEAIGRKREVRKKGERQNMSGAFWEGGKVLNRDFYRAAPNDLERKKEEVRLDRKDKRAVPRRRFPTGVNQMHACGRKNESGPFEKACPTCVRETRAAKENTKASSCGHSLKFVKASL